MGHQRFRRHPVPDNEVVNLLEGVLQAARQGYVRSVALIVVNPLHSVEIGTAGDQGPIYTNALIGGLARITNILITKV